MKRKLIAAILCAAMFALCAAGCGEDEASSKPAAATTDEPQALSTAAVESTALSEPAESTEKPTEKKSDKKEKATTAPASTAAEGETQQPTKYHDVPSDTVSGANINPNLQAIQGRVISEMNSLAVREISLEKNELELAAGETAEVKVIFNPADAANKSCAVSVSSDCVQAVVSAAKLKVTAKSEGSAEITVTSHNGKTAVCRVTVTSEAPQTTQVLLDETTAAKLCEDISADCESRGLTKNSSLSGTPLIISDAGASYHALKNNLTAQVGAAIEAAATDAVQVTGYNCYYESGEGCVVYFAVETVPVTEPAETSAD